METNGKGVLAPLAVALERKDKKGRTPLLLASYKGKMEMVGVLIKAGADVHAKDTHGLPFSWELRSLAMFPP